MHIPHTLCSSCEISLAGYRVFWICPKDCVLPLPVCDLCDQVVSQTPHKACSNLFILQHESHLLGIVIIRLSQLKQLFYSLQGVLGLCRALFQLFHSVMQNFNLTLPPFLQSVCWFSLIFDCSF